MPVYGSVNALNRKPRNTKQIFLGVGNSLFKTNEDEFVLAKSNENFSIDVTPIKSALVMEKFTD